MARYIIIVSLLIFVGCAPPYNPQPKVDTIKPVLAITPSVAFNNYKKEVAANYRKLAQNCLDGSYEFVSELVDAAKALDKESKPTMSKPIDRLFADALGNDKLDSKKAADVLIKVADDLDPLPKGKP